MSRDANLSYMQTSGPKVRAYQGFDFTRFVLFLRFDIRF